MPIDRICVLVALVGVTTLAGGAEPIDIGSRRELFVDRLLIDRMTDTSLSLHRPVCADVAIRKDKPWEGTSSFGYITVFKDHDLYRMYYRAIPGEGKTDGSPEEMVCYAESTDGIHWTKPDVNLYVFEGSKKNNIVLYPHAPVLSQFHAAIGYAPRRSRRQTLQGLGGSYALLSRCGCVLLR